MSNTSEELPPRYDDADALLRHIADMLNCRLCGDKFKKPVSDFDKAVFCSSHRDPILLANGYVHGWTKRGGMPKNMVG